MKPNVQSHLYYQILPYKIVMAGANWDKLTDYHILPGNIFGVGRQLSWLPFMIINTSWM
jgi:hypothetical protein